VRGLNWGEERPAGPRRGRWSQVEEAVLKALYGLRDVKAIARELNRSEESVRRKAEELFRGPRRSGPWTSQEVERLKGFLGLNAPEVIARILGRPQEEVDRQIFALGRIRRDGEWTREELQHFRRVYGTRSDDDLSLIFGRTLRSVRTLARELCLAKDKAFLKRQRGAGATRMPRWGQDELRLLRELYPSTSNLEIARQLERSVKSVVSKAHHLGLKKAAERLEEMGRQNVSLRYRGRRAGLETRSDRDGSSDDDGV
jgi:hypothetical protein